MDNSRNVSALCSTLRAGIPKPGGWINLENAPVNISWTPTIYQIGEIIFAELICKVVFNTL